jgi:hypothetical protein
MQKNIQTKREINSESRNGANREKGLIEKKIDRAIGIIEQSATRVLRTRKTGIEK